MNKNLFLKNLYNAMIIKFIMILLYNLIYNY